MILDKLHQFTIPVNTILEFSSKDELIITFSYEPLHTDAQVLANQQELIYNGALRTSDVV